MSTHFSNPKDDEDWDEEDGDQHPDLQPLRRWLIATATKGPMAENAYCPDWYSHMVAAEELRCKPWELDDVPVYWIQIAMVKRQAEIEAQRIVNQPKG